MGKSNCQGNTDAALMRSIALGDERAFAELYQRYGRRMFRFYYRMLRRDASRAEDFTQELFLKIIEHPKAYDPGRPFMTWLYTVAANMCKNEYRRQSRSPIELTESLEDAPTESVLESIDYQLLENQLRVVIDTLEEPQRQCFILRYQEELSVRDIACIMDCPEGTVKSRLHYALRQVRLGMQTTYRTMNKESFLHK